MNNIKRLIFSTQTEEELPPCIYRYANEVYISAQFPQTVTLSYTLKNGTPVTQSWEANGTGEIVYHSFSIAECVVEDSVEIDVGTIINIIWIDSISCCP